MSLTTPIVVPIIPFSADTDYTVTFSVGSGSDQVVANILNIYDNSDNSLVFTNNLTSFLLQNIIPKNTLTNGKVYKATITTKDVSGNSSTPSDPVIFYCLSNPTYTFTNIDEDGKVYNQNVTFSCTYSQAESEILQEYLYSLYDSSKNLIQSYSGVYSSTPTLTQLVSGLANNTLYHIEVNTISVHGQIGSSGLVPFTAIYVAPSLYSTLTTTPNSNNGSIKLNAIVIQEIGNMDVGIAVYVDNTWIDLTSGQQVSFSDGFSIDSANFILKIWCKNIPNDTVFLKLYSSIGRIELFMSTDNCAHAYVYLDGLDNVRYHYISNSVLISTDQAFMIYMKSQYNLLDLYLTKV